MSAPSRDKLLSDSSLPLLATHYGDDHKQDKTCCHGHCTWSLFRLCGFELKCYQFRSKIDRVIFAVFFFSLLSFLIAAIVPVVIRSFLNTGINNDIVISSTSSPSYDSWQTNTQSDGQPIHYDVYMFDIVNTDEVLLSGAKPVLVERGPYAYREYYNKFEIEWKNGGEYVSYYEQKYYVFSPELSGPDLDPKSDIITNVNLITQGVAYLLTTGNQKVTGELNTLSHEFSTQCTNNSKGVQETLCTQILPYLQHNYHKNFTQIEDVCKLPLSIFQKKCLLSSAKFSAIIKIFDQIGVWRFVLKTLMCASDISSPFVQRTPQELYFGWDNDPLIETMLNLFSTFQLNITGISASFPGITTNYTDEAYTRRMANKDTFNTGSKHISKIDQYIYYQNMTEMRVCLSGNCSKYQYEWNSSVAEENGWTLAWATAEANQIIGTDGLQFSHKNHESLAFNVFIDDIYRWGETTYQKTYDWNGVELRRYGLRQEDLMSAFDNPANAAYYQWCPTGTMNFTSVAGFPLFASKPHYLDGADSLLEAIEGIIPSREIHDTYLDVEPLTGLTFVAAKRLQINTYLENWNLPLMDFSKLDLVVEAIAKKVFNITIGDKEANALVDLLLHKTFPNLNLISFEKCLQTDMNWNIINDGVYIPYAWADEYSSASDDDVDTFKTEIYGTQDFANAVFLWSLIVGTTLMICSFGMILINRMIIKEMKSNY